ncbi:short-chain dehydrogenase [Bacillus cereus]|uniref:SDR family NAD(P)-dependent oxidoreductase n=1 Tax=Bacillus nitratireducens TaxID=2026193 RepID=UPI000BED66DB|nr:SDR family NAD(P)-dependent oxidoreductase [Bacillus nitratireducens]PEA21293.1 short-chain dehydrogenase [Bacillus cereus]PEU01222.1 short-chain dehydrogenase [Bacillus cereus]PFC04285.1 short-chain dehydrogenase [Bacillus cereus]PFE66933.1 short-chain dehydrogenase [Bacillus cereus]PFP98722.1 short-chain dehydrogenase [Bacillus cereus]
MRVLITGGNRGLGLELVKVFHENGHVVYPLVRTEVSVMKLKKMFSSRCFPILADLSTDESTEQIKNQLEEYTEYIDLVINNAGITGKETEILRTNSEELMELFNVHCLGVIRAVKGTYAALTKSNQPRIINVSSRLGSLHKMAGKEFPQGQFSYSYRIAKAAQNMLTLCLQQEFENEGIGVTAIHPGKLKTDIGAFDANMTPAEGAQNIYDWVIDSNEDVSGKFIEPGVGELKW